MSKQISKILTGTVMVLALWSCKPSASNGNLSVSNTNRDQFSSGAEERYGLSEAKRKQISEEIFSLWVQVGNIASNKVPLITRGEKSIGERMQAGARRRAEMRHSLMKDYIGALAKKYNLSTEQLAEIQSEGIEKEWTKYPMPPPEYR